MMKKKIEEWIHQLDRLPRDASCFADIEHTASTIARFYGFEKIVTSPLEQAALLTPLVRAGLLDEWPPVRGKTQNGEEFLLTPSGAIGALRAYFSHRLQNMPHPVKLFFHSQGFSQLPLAFGSAIVARDEWGIAIIGEESAVAETGIAQVFYRTTAELGINDRSIELRLNAIGCPACRVSYRTSLGAYFRRHLARLCTRSKRDLKRAPTRILSCTEERCRSIAANAPQGLDFLCDRCKKQLRSLLEFLDEAKIPYFLDPKFFRDGSWYTEVIFELLLERTEEVSRPPEPSVPDIRVPDVVASGMEQILAEESEPAPVRIPAVPSAPRGKVVLAEGGRVSHAASLIGGREVPVAVGIMFLETVAGALARQEAMNQQRSIEVFFVQLGDLAKRRSFEILEALREGGIEAKESLGRDSIKTQLKIAERLGARFAVILGQKEALDGTVIVREVGSGIQETVPQDKLVDFLKKKLKKI
ncbi:MAG: hypothetical protein A3J10_00050 [Candidatus Sungbacteria bacterium RIFCSPLOWO2_02_FULL_54_10]|nr:MAG: hypothetical protein A3J10_00050 [Candidatus Sungbacteria bacterium RIFCSPLOWO2_02_FULL_54_10]